MGVDGSEADCGDALRAVYRRHAGAFDRRRSRILFERGWLQRFLALCPPGAPVLDLGCGAGEPVARYLIEASRDLTGVDFAPEMLAMARLRFPRVEWIEADMRRLDLGRRFGGIVAWDSFFHLAPDEQRAMFPVFTRHLVPGGALLFTSGPDAGEATGQVEGEPVHHASLSPAEYVQVMRANGLIVRAFVAEDPECDRHSVWLGEWRSERQKSQGVLARHPARVLGNPCI